MSVTDEFDYHLVVYDSCFCAGRIPGRECYGAITHEHIVSKQRIKKRVKPVRGRQVRALRDRRNILGCCFGCHIGCLTTGNPLVQVQPSDLPDGFFDFLAEYGLEGSVPRQLQSVVA